MRVLVFFTFIILLNFSITVNAVEISSASSSQLDELQNYRSNAKLYAPNFVLIGENAVFKVYSKPNEKVKLTLNYGSNISQQTFEQNTNKMGIATFSVPILDNEELVGKSVQVDAFIQDKANKIRKAILQNESGSASSYNRIYIADKNAAKGFLFTPWKCLNQFIMNVNYEERSGYDPINDQIYDETTPIYVRNMRDAQDNVREIPTNTNYTD